MRGPRLQARIAIVFKHLNHLFRQYPQVEPVPMGTEKFILIEMTGLEGGGGGSAMDQLGSHKREEPILVGR